MTSMKRKRIWPTPRTHNMNRTKKFDIRRIKIRINQGDLDALKARAKRRGVKYQAFITEVLHRMAHS